MTITAIAISPDISKTANRCLKYVNRYGDGLSIDHLASLLPKTPRFLLHKALAHLVQQDLVIHAKNHWYYPIEEPKDFEPIIVKPKTQELIMTIPMQHKQTSVITKIRNWFEQRDPGSAPIELVELVELCGDVRRDSVTRALKALLDEYKLDNPEKHEQLDAAIVRRKYLPKEENEKISCPELENWGVTKPVPIVEPAVPTLQVQEENWVEEFRHRLIAKRIPDNARQWAETLQQMDKVFEDLDIPSEQRVRKHLREIVEWLSV